MNDFQVSITVNTPPEKVIQLIGNVPEWWGITCEGETHHPNDQFVIKMGDQAFFHMTVTELVPGKRLVWSVGDCYMPWYSDKTEWSNTRLIFNLSEKGGETTVVFTHEGLTPQRECYGDCEPGWTHWIKTSLVSYLTTGKGVFRQPTK